MSFSWMPGFLTTKSCKRSRACDKARRRRGLFRQRGFEPLESRRLLAAQLSVADITVIEGQPADFTVNLSEPSSEALTVDYWTDDGTAYGGYDFEYRYGHLTFAPGETSKTVSVATLTDFEQESDEDFYLDFYAHWDWQYVSATGTIEDDPSSIPTQKRG